MGRIGESGSRMTEPLVWPSWRYRRNPENGGMDMRVFQNLSELLNAGEGWVTSPADIDSAEATAAALSDPGANDEHQGEEAASEPGEINFAGLDDEALREIAAKAGIKVDRRWGRATLEAKLREAA